MLFPFSFSFLRLSVLIVCDLIPSIPASYVLEHPDFFVASRRTCPSTRNLNFPRLCLQRCQIRDPLLRLLELLPQTLLRASRALWLRPFNTSTLMVTICLPRPHPLVLEVDAAMRLRQSLSSQKAAISTTPVVSLSTNPQPSNKPLPQAASPMNTITLDLAILLALI